MMSGRLIVCQVPPCQENATVTARSHAENVTDREDTTTCLGCSPDESKGSSHMKSLFEGNPCGVPAISHILYCYRTLYGFQNSGAIGALLKEF
ncbi:hypothetical protein BS47DRAFT_727619 [Hydnum rufescens UP504]|uniref:Uncharacterized protein n=1 Tax=Hydnum rufescens UP504 TaxID=1448309 RepID=A0A9P6B1P9_9AGAM|nr:hypothetical protein BS47DRAFT_727619 [Hydnum rufescens UP504]